MRVSIVLPVYNGCAHLRKNFPRIYRAAKRLGSFEIIIVNDGSKDCTAEAARRLAGMRGVKLIQKEQNEGRGAALKSAFAMASGNTVGYMDIDLAVKLKYLERAVREVENGHKIVVGSRYLEGSHAKRSGLRRLLSRAYNLMIKLLFNSKVADHQCGFKFMDADFAKREARRIADNRWFFDSAMIIDAERHGITPLEIPVEWKEGRRTTVRKSDIVYFIKAMIEYRLSIRRGA